MQTWGPQHHVPAPEGLHSGPMQRGKRGGPESLACPAPPLLPGLETLAQTQPVCTGLGLSHFPLSPANQTGTAAVTLGHENTFWVRISACHPSPWRPGCHLICLHRPPRLLSSPTKHTEAQSRHCGSPLFHAVTEVAAPSQVVGTPTRASAPALRGSWVAAPRGGSPVRRAGRSCRPLPDGRSSRKAEG